MSDWDGPVIGGQGTLDARAAVDEMVAAWQLHEVARKVPGGAMHVANVTMNFISGASREQIVTALSYATRKAAMLLNSISDITEPRPDE